MITYKNNIDVLQPNVVVPGQSFYASSSVGNANNGGARLAPMDSLTNALALTTASKGDYIYLLPGHAEDVGSAAGISIAKNGVTIQGLGNGSLMPKFSFTAADATIAVAAHNVTFKNIQFEANFADVAIGLDIGAYDNITFEDCLFTDASTILNYVIVIDLATGADNFKVKNCKCLCQAAANDSFINGVAHNGFTVVDSQIYFTTAQTAAAGQIYASGNVTNTLIKNCDFVCLTDGALHIDLHAAANTGVIAYCNFSSADGAGAVTTAVDATGCHVFQCYVAGEADSFGLIGGGTVYNNS